MLLDHNIVTASRPEPDLTGLWGLYLVGEDRWMDIIYASEREAQDATIAFKGILAGSEIRFAPRTAANVRPER